MLQREKKRTPSIRARRAIKLRPSMRLGRKSRASRECGLSGLSQSYFELMAALPWKIMALAKWYFLGSTLLVMATSFLTWTVFDCSGQEDLLMLFLAGILMLTFLFCIPLAIMNFLSKDYLFTVAMTVLGYFMVGAHFKVMDTLGAANIQMQVCMVFLGACVGGIMVIYQRNIMNT